MLRDKIPSGFERLKQAFAALNERSESPELMMILRQLQNSRACGVNARLYYESKVMEAVSIVLAYAEENQTYGALLSEDDAQQLKAVELFINEHYGSELRLMQPASLGCMAAEYIASLRLDQAKKLLEDRYLSITHIA
ncbi:MAG: hypothetical protein GX096_02335 [Clostridiales bacterium]|nr:hypothetical protein [Clostridiales bacterium]